MENPLCVLLAQHFLNLLVKVPHTHQVTVFEVLIELREGVKQADVLAQFAPELQGVAIRLNACAGTETRLRELVLAIVALGLEEWVNALALLARLPLFARKVAVFHDFRHSPVPLARGQFAHEGRLVLFLIRLRLRFEIVFFTDDPAVNKLETMALVCFQDDVSITWLVQGSLIQLRLLGRDCRIRSTIKLGATLEAIVRLRRRKHRVAIDAHLLLRDYVLLLLV